MVDEWGRQCAALWVCGPVCVWVCVWVWVWVRVRVWGSGVGVGSGVLGMSVVRGVWGVGYGVWGVGSGVARALDMKKVQ